MSNFNPQSLSALKKQIDNSRQKLQELWDTHGHTDDEVLAAGIELDNLLNEYQKLKPQRRA